MAQIQIGIVIFFLRTVLMTREVRTSFERKMCQQLFSLANCSHPLTLMDLACHVLINKSSRSRRSELMLREEEKHLTTKAGPWTVLPCSKIQEARISPSVSVLYAYGKQVYKVPVIPEMKECFVRGFKGKIEAMVYSRTYKYIIAGTTRPEEILTFKENDLNNEPETLTSKYSPKCMTIDNNIDIVFIGAYDGIEKYNLKDRVKTGLYDEKMVISLALNTKKQIIYFSSYGGIRSLQYNGENQKVISLKFSSNVGFIESVNEVYYLSRNQVTSIVSYRGSIKGVPLSAKVSSFVSDQNLIVYATSNKITILNTTSNKSTQVKTRYLGTSPVVAVMKPIELG